MGLVAGRRPHLLVGNRLGHVVLLFSAAFDQLTGHLGESWPPSYTPRLSSCTIDLMDVAVSELRAHLSEWLDRARDGEEVVVTDRGVPVARLLGITASAILERLAAEGVIGRPERIRRTSATGRSRPRPRHSVSALVSEQRR